MVDKMKARKRAARAAGTPVVPRLEVATGAAVDTDIAVADIKPNDVVLAALHFVPGTPAFADVADEVTISSSGNIQLDTTDTSGGQLLVFFLES